MTKAMAKTNEIIPAWNARGVHPRLTIEPDGIWARVVSRKGKPIAMIRIVGHPVYADGRAMSETHRPWSVCDLRYVNRYRRERRFAKLESAIDAVWQML